MYVYVYTYLCVYIYIYMHELLYTCLCCNNHKTSARETLLPQVQLQELEGETATLEVARNGKVYATWLFVLMVSGVPRSSCSGLGYVASA